MSRYDGIFEPGARVGSTIQDNFREKLPKSLSARHDDTVGDLVVRVLGEIIQSPEKYAIKAKKRCAKYHPSFSSQDLCMGNEINSYRKIRGMLK